MEIRAAREHDLPDLWPLLAQLASAAMTVKSQRALTRSIGDDRSGLLLATSGARRVGYAWVRHWPGHYLFPGIAELEHLVVAAGARRAGIGSALLTSAHAWAEERGAAGLIWWAEERNANFYRHFGNKVGLTTRDEGRTLHLWRAPRETDEGLAPVGHAPG